MRHARRRWKRLCRALRGNTPPPREPHGPLPVLDRALALVFTFVLRAGLVLADWLSGAMRCVYKRGCSTVFTNFRGVVLTGHIAKLFELVLLKRLLRVAGGVDEEGP